MALTVHEFTTTHKENFTHEFAPTPGQLQRAVQFQGEWTRNRYEIEVDKSMKVEDVFNHLRQLRSLPSMDDQGDPIYYSLIRVEEPLLLDAVPVRPLLAGWFQGL